MPVEDVFQAALVQVSLLEQLLDARLILGPANAGGDGHDVFGPENFGGHAFVINTLGLAHSFLGQTAGGEKLHGESPDQQVLAFHLPTVCLQMRVNGGNACGQAFILRDEKNIRVVSGEWFDVVNCRERAAQRPVFNQSRRHEIVRPAQNIGQRQTVGLLIDSHVERITKFTPSRKLVRGSWNWCRLYRAWNCFDDEPGAWPWAI